MASLIQDKSIESAEVKPDSADRGPPREVKENAQIKSPKLPEESSMLSSIKTSVDDETLMELAKKGITAATPVIKGKETGSRTPRSPKNIQIETV